MNIFNINDIFSCINEANKMREKCDEMLKVMYLNLNESCKDDEAFISYLLKETYNYNMLQSFCDLIKIVKREENAMYAYWNDFEQKLLEYEGEYFRNKNLLSNIEKNIELRDHDEIYFYLSKLKKSFVSCEIITKDMKILETQIYDMLIINDIIKIHKDDLKELRGKTQLKTEDVSLTKKNYMTLVENLKYPENRYKYYKMYCKKTNSCLFLLARLLSARHKCAINMGHKNYFEYENSSQCCDYDVKQMIHNFTNEIDYTFNKIIEQMTLKTNTSKILFSDIEYFEKYPNCPLLTPKLIFENICRISEIYFGMFFVKRKLISWDKKNMTYKCEDKIGNLLGYLHIGFVGNEILEGTISVKLTDKYEIDGVTTLTHVALITNCLEWNDNTIDIKYAEKMYREFGHIIYNLYYVSNVGKLNFDKEFCELFPSLMENIFWDKKNLENLYTNIDVNDLIKFHKHKKIINLKFLGFYALYDNIIHSSVTLIDTIRTNYSNKDMLTFLMEEIYSKIFVEYFLKNPLISTKNSKTIDPILILKIVDNSEGTYFGKLLSVMLAHTLHKSLKTQKSDVVLFKNSIVPFKSILRKFISDINVDSYEEYINYLTQTEDNNDFEEN